MSLLISTSKVPSSFTKHRQSPHTPNPPEALNIVKYSGVQGRFNAWAWHSFWHIPERWVPSRPFWSMMVLAALFTACCRESLPTWLSLRELRARFCLLVPKASIRESTWNKVQRAVTPAQSSQRERGCWIIQSQVSGKQWRNKHLPCPCKTLMKLGGFLPHE